MKIMGGKDDCEDEDCLMNDLSGSMMSASASGSGNGSDDGSEHGDFGFGMGRNRGSRGGRRGRDDDGGWTHHSLNMYNE